MIDPLVYLWLLLKASPVTTTGAGNLPVLSQDLVPRGWATGRQFAEALAIGRISSYDHPFNAPFEHALNIDFVNEALGPGARVATINAVLERAEAGGYLEQPAAAAQER